MTCLRAFSVFALLALPVQAAEPMSAQEFDAYVTGKTLHYGLGGDAYGVEEYLSNRRVRWSFMDGDCKDGSWYEAADGQICFVYEDSPEAPQCWLFYREGSRLRAVFEGDTSATVLYEAEQNTEPMLCYGPKIGV